MIKWINNACWAVRHAYRGCGVMNTCNEQVVCRRVALLAFLHTGGAPTYKSTSLISQRHVADEVESGGVGGNGWGGAWWMGIGEGILGDTAIIRGCTSLESRSDAEWSGASLDLLR